MRRRGANAVEFALILPFLVLFIAGIVDVSWYLNQHQLLIQAVRDAARSGAVEDADSAEIAAEETAIQSLDALGLDSGTADISTDVIEVGNDRAIHVRIITPHESLFPFPGLKALVEHDYELTIRLADQR